MRIIIVDNVVGRRSRHKKIMRKFVDHTFFLEEECTIDHFLKNKYDIYVVHKNNQVEYKYVYNEKLGDHRIFFSGGQTKIHDTDDCLFADIETMYARLNELLSNVP